MPNFEMEMAEIISDMSFTFRLHLKHISREVATLALRREPFECGQIRWRLFGKAFQQLVKQVSQNSNDRQEPQIFLKYIVLDDSVTPQSL